MSSFTRTIQRAVKRDKFYNGRGRSLGVVNAKARDLLARLKRENRRD